MTSSPPPPVPVLRDPERTLARTGTYVVIGVALAVLFLGLFLGFKAALILGVIAIAVAMAFGRNAIEAGFGWNPPQLEIAPGPYNLGSTPTVTYRRRPRRIVDISAGTVECELTCDEWVRYRQGTDTRTDDRTVFEREWSTEGEGTADGFVAEITLDLAAHAGGPTLDLLNNKVTWRVEIATRGARLPKDSHRFVIEVGPTLDHALRAGVSRSGLQDS